MNKFLNAPSSDFAAVRDGRRSMPLWMDIDLSTARSIAAGTALVMNVAGNSFYSDQNVLQGVATVHFQDTSLGMTSAPITVNPGFIAGVPFTQLLIENAAQPGFRLRIFYGVDIDFTPGTGGLVNISGTVSVINGELSRVKNNSCFITQMSVAGVAGQYSHIQLFNAAGSGKNLILNKASVYSQSAQVVYLNQYDTALTAFSVGSSKLRGGANSIGSIKGNANASILGAVVGNFAIDMAGQSKEFPFAEPFVIPPGFGMCFVAGMVNTSLSVTYQWNEENQ